MVNPKTIAIQRMTVLQGAVEVVLPTLGLKQVRPDVDSLMSLGS